MQANSRYRRKLLERRRAAVRRAARAAGIRRNTGLRRILLLTLALETSAGSMRQLRWWNHTGMNLNLIRLEEQVKVEWVKPGEVQEREIYGVRVNLDTLEIQFYRYMEDRGES